MEHDIEEVCIKPDITAMEMNISRDDCPGTASTNNDQVPRSVNEKTSKNNEISTTEYGNDSVNRISCPICDTTFKTLTYQKQHLKYAHATEADVVECPQCYRSFRSIAHLRYHNRAVHAEVKEIPCNICQKTFHNKKRLVSHMYSVHPDPNKTVSCQICDRSFKSKCNLKYHMRNMHVSDEDYVSCSHCDKQFKNNIFLNAHVKRSHSADAMLYRCQQCNKTFPSIVGYKDHVGNVHTSKHVECPICFKTLNKSITRHMKVMHADDKPLLKKAGDLQCSHCDKRFVKKKTLDCHIERCHGEQGYKF